MRTFLKAIFLIIIWGSLLGGGYLFYEAHTFLNTPASTTEQEVTFSIKPGSTFDRVAWDLKKAGIITDVLRFRLLAQYHDALGKVKAGEFLLSTGWTPDKVLYQITQGQAMLYRLSIREGLTWWETAKSIEEQGFATYDDFKAVIHDPEFLRKHGIPFANAEGFLYPETYMLKKPRAPLDKEQAQEVADVMVRMFWRKTEPIWKELPLRDGLDAGSRPGGPLLPEQPGAMSSSPGPASGSTGTTESRIGGNSSGQTGADQRPQSRPERQQAPAAIPEQVHTGTLESGSAPVNVGTALPGANNVVEPHLPATRQEGWHSTIPPASPVPGLPASPAAGQDRQTATPVQEGGNANSTPSGSPDAAQAVVLQPAESSGGGQAAPATPGGNSSIPENVPVNPSSGTVSPGPAGAPEAQGTLKASGPQSPAEVDPKSLRLLLTLASLVEKETGVPEERARVAGVYANRLRVNMLLQCDPTIIYGIGPSFSGAIRRSQIDDPKNMYNTYQHPGLPPGPICSPGFMSLKAAFAPEVHDYYYFVATGIDAGHTFSKNLAEHNKAVQVYRERIRAGNKTSR